MDETETSLDKDLEPHPVRPSVSGRRMASGHAPAAPQKSPWRIFIYVFVFACLVALSLVLRSSSRSVKTGTQAPGSSSTVLRPSLPGIAASAPAAGGPIIDNDFARTSCNRPDVLQ